ncbi:MAG: HPF/RaiA family ribosome-associated protein [Planctomycetota bacterium]
MNLAIRGKKIDLTPAILDHIRQRMSAALDQYSGRVRSVSVLLSDENGPRGGIDQLCRVHVHLLNGKTLRHTRRGDDLYVNVSLLADIVKSRVGRYLGKARQYARTPLANPGALPG